MSLGAVRSTTEVSIIVAIDEWQESLLLYRHFRTFLPLPIVYVFLTTSGRMHTCDIVRFTLSNEINVHALSRLLLCGFIFSSNDRKLSRIQDYD